MKQSTQYVLIRRGDGLMRRSPARWLEATTRYTVLERLGEGALAVVHRAIEHRIDGSERVVALKRFLPRLGDDRGFIDALAGEVGQAAGLCHRNLATLFRLGRGGTGWFLSSEYVRGRDLGAALACHPDQRCPPAEVALSLIEQLLAGLAAVHAAADLRPGPAVRLAHGNLTPANLLIEDTGRLVLTDLGLDRAAAARQARGSGGVRVAHQAPELAAGGRATPRSDVFAAGAIAWELVTGRRLLAGSRAATGQSGAAVRPPSAIRAGVPAELDAAIVRALEVEPRRRWADAAAFAAALAPLYRRLAPDPAHGEAQVARWMALSLAPVRRPLSSGSLDREVGDEDAEDTQVFRRRGRAR